MKNMGIPNKWGDTNEHNRGKFPNTGKKEEKNSNKNSISSNHNCSNCNYTEL